MTMRGVHIDLARAWRHDSRTYWCNVHHLGSEFELIPKQLSNIVAVGSEFLQFAAPAERVQSLFLLNCICQCSTDNETEDFAWLDWKLGKRAKKLVKKVGESHQPVWKSDT